MPERQLSIVKEPVSWSIPSEFLGIMGYNPRHDIQDYLDLKNLNGQIPPQEYAQLLIQTNNRIRRQLEKALGERFAVEKSTIIYFIDEEGHLRSPDYPEPVVERYEKGRQFLAENGSTETERESAEVEGICQIENLLKQSVTSHPLRPRLASTQARSEASQLPVTLIIVSPCGSPDSLYTENYFDVYQKTGPTITMTRYYSTHDLPGFLKAAQTVDPNFAQNLSTSEESRQRRGSLKTAEPTSEVKPLVNAVFFLKNPIQTQKPLSELLEVFALDQTTQKYELNQQIIEACTPLILSYISTLALLLDTSEESRQRRGSLKTAEPTSEVQMLDATIEQIKLTLNAIFNLADATEKELQEEKIQNAYTQFKADQSAYADRPTENLISHYGNLPVRATSFGCPGGQKGFALRRFAKAIGARQVSDFARFYGKTDDEDEDTSDFQCPGYKKDGSKCTYIVRYGSGIRKCPECGMEATCA